MLHWRGAGEGFVDLRSSLRVSVSMAMMNAGTEGVAREGGKR